MTADPSAPVTPQLALARLRPRYGDLPWRPHGDAVGELVLTILSQHTNDTLSGKAFARLLAMFPTWEAITAAPAEAIAGAIREGGLAGQKAPRIKAVLQRIWEELGAFDLTFLKDLPLEEARAWLLALPGVGPKTAACVLMFALGRPALPVDTHVYRVSRRLGLIPANASEARAHTLLEAMVPAEDVYAFHVALIKHGRHTCTARAPRCADCPLNDVCPSAFRVNNAKPRTASTAARGGAS
jgi:endonuclease-3